MGRGVGISSSIQQKTLTLLTARSDVGAERSMALVVLGFESCASFQWESHHPRRSTVESLTVAKSAPHSLLNRH